MPRDQLAFGHELESLLRALVALVRRIEVGESELLMISILRGYVAASPRRLTEARNTAGVQPCSGTRYEDLRNLFRRCPATR